MKIITEACTNRGHFFLFFKKIKNFLLSIEILSDFVYNNIIYWDFLPVATNGKDKIYRMEQVISFFKNKWTRFGFSFLAPLYPIFLVYITWLSFAYSLEPTAPIPLFLLYVLLNFIFGGLFFYTRKQVITRISVCIAPLILFIMMIMSFGEWYMIIPPVAISAVVFLASGAGETLKTVLGTLYLMMFVVGALVYLTMLHFNLTPKLLLHDLLFGNYCDISTRSDNYVYSEDGTYRLVQYVDDAGNERKATAFYVEETENDVHLWYLDCYKTSDSLKVLVTMHQDEVEYYWMSDTDLYIDGREKNIPEMFEKARANSDEESAATESVKKPIIFAETDSSAEETAAAEAAE